MKTKVFLVIIVILSVMLVHTQPPPGTEEGRGGQSNNRRGPGGNGGEASPFRAFSGSPDSSGDIWNCNFNFYWGSSSFTEYCNGDNPEVHRGGFDRLADNMIQSFNWDGDRCYCWVIFYQTANWGGPNIGFWIDTSSGEYDLSYYTTYDFDDCDWERWDESVSSYDVYCY